jgi:hypothetical protein
VRIVWGDETKTEMGFLLRQSRNYFTLISFDIGCLDKIPEESDPGCLQVYQIEASF